MCAMLKYETRYGVNQIPNMKVYIAFGKEDYRLYYEMLCEEILDSLNCAVFCRQGWDDPFNEADIADYLGEMNLIILPVTHTFLQGDLESVNLEIIFAVNNNIPILPILLELDLEDLYMEKMNRLGDNYSMIQFLNRTSTCPTEISYKDKLKKRLEQLVIGEELISRIQSAFDAYIFLSYRKIDREHAKNIMQLIHSIPFCQNIAIWYDEYLTPGESWKVSIAEALARSILMLLAVTPNVSEPGNYIIEQEYPLARNLGKEIIPIEVIPTDFSVLKCYFPELSVPIDVNDINQLKLVLSKALSRLSLNSEAGTSEHRFMIGLSYLYGIDVEIDRSRAIHIIQEIAEEGLPEALHTMALIHLNGNGVPISYKYAQDWYKEYIAALKEKGESKQEVLEVLRAYDEYCDFLLDYGFVLSYSSVANYELLQYTENSCTKLGVFSFLGWMFYPDEGTEEDQELVFYLCKAHYRCVQSGMERDLDYSHCTLYANELKRWLPYLTIEEYKRGVSQWIEYLDGLPDSVDEFFQEINEKRKTSQPNAKPNPDELIEQVSQAEAQYQAEPNDKLKEKLICIYEDLLELLKMQEDVEQYSHYCRRYYPLKISLFKRNPELLDHIELETYLDDSIQFIEQSGSRERLIDILQIAIDYLNYCAGIGYGDEKEMQKIQAKLSEVL